MIIPKRLLHILLAVSFPAIFLLSFRRVDTDEGAKLASHYCGSCHLTPDPHSLPKYVWQFKVLPVMASYLGLRYMNYQPYGGLSAEEAELLAQQHVYPDQAVISEEKWQTLVAWYVDNAPAASLIDSARLIRNQPFSQFTVQHLPLGKTVGAMVTAIAYDTTRQELWVAEPDKLYRWNWTKGLTRNYNLPGTVVDIKFSGTRSLLTEIGTLLPAEKATGGLFSLADDSLATIQSGLHRPVYSVVADLNNDGLDELITANYGHRSGALSLFTKPAGQTLYTEKVLLNVPGAVKFYVRDMNHDGRNDIIALFAQNTESVYIFYQTSNLEFRAEKVVQFEPQYGTSDFIVLDYNHDGIDDLALVHGDNADYSYCLKKFHGLRLLLGSKSGTYTQAFFYPIYGATRLQADDFDQDGDVDFAVSAFFPELTRLASESFVYLENTGSETFRFVPHTLESPVPIKSLTLEKADIDRDGDLDLLLGQFSYSPVPVPPALQQQWNTVSYKLVVLVNQQHR